MATYDEIRTHLTEAIPRISKKKLDELSDWIYELDPSEDGKGLDSVEITGRRAAIQRTEAFGLELELDANGNATTVHFPYGAHVA